MQAQQQFIDTKKVIKVKEKQDLWELVRKKLEKNNQTETVSMPNKEPVKSSQQETTREEKKESKLQTQINKLDSNKKIPVIEKFNLLNQGVFAGFVYILSIMIILGILMIPGSITAAIGGYFGGCLLYTSPSPRDRG